MRLLSINSLMITTGIGCLALVATSSWAAAAPQADRGLETRPNRLDDQPQDLQRPGFQGPGGVPGPGDRQGPGGFPGPPGRGGPPGFGPGGPGQQAKIELVDRFDADANGFLDADERAEARQALETEGNNRQGPRRGPGGNRPTGSPGP
ncbi:MAG: hypothetical protein KDA83_02465, partial [Planctomycetales bacterium]|nr:hypothetical protein [Planctomycetales bacterium]